MLVPEPGARVLQVHKSYLVTQDEQGVVIIDQHALHERVMFEYLLARVMGEAGGTLESQRLLTPAVVAASAAQIERLDVLGPLLGRLGVQAEALGPASVGVHAFPTFLFDRGVDPVDFVQDLLERSEDAAFVEDLTRGGEAAMRDVLDMMSCKAAVKAGDRLSEGELSELARLRGEVERSSNCPHGRPTSVRLTIRDLEKLFGRA
jgi:DNA mismatch repair protein MutL